MTLDLDLLEVIFTNEENDLRTLTENKTVMPANAGIHQQEQTVTPAKKTVIPENKTVMPAKAGIHQQEQTLNV